MTDKEKIRAEIIRLYNQSLEAENRQVELGLKSAACTSYGKEKACKELLSFIDSMQEEPVSEDLEEKAQKAYPEDIHKQSIFIHGATYAYTHSKNTQLLDEGLEEAATKYAQDKYMAVQTFQAFKAGAQWQKQQIMKNAKDGVITFDYYGDNDKIYGCIAHDSFCLEELGLKDGDKVKLIIIKEN